MSARLLGPPGDAVKGVVFDLDDTLYPQRAWLEGACEAVAERAAHFGIDPDALRGALARELALGSDRGGTIDRALEAVGASAPIEPLVAAFRAYAPARLDPYPGVGEALRSLSSLVPLALVSDGDASGQRAKLAATGLAGYFSAVVLSDELGREHRKPDPLPYTTALAALGLPAEVVVAVGDRPAKDVLGATRAGLRAVRVRTGEYASDADAPSTWAVADDVAEAARLVASLVAPRAVPSP